MSRDWSKSAITVYSPDTILSGLAPALGTFIVNATGLQHESAFLAIHDESSIDRFYKLQRRSADSQQAALVRDLFVSRPLIVTTWRGPDALLRLQNIKGATQPALAQAGSIRSLFWCDNPVCNLIHVSDDIENMERDYGILLDRRVAELRKNRARQDKYLLSPSMARHNALLEFRRVLSRNVLCTTATKLHTSLAQDGNACCTALAIIRDLIRDVQAGPAVAKVLTNSFLFAQRDFYAASKKYLGPCSAWERLVIHCGIASNRLWVDRLCQSQSDKWLVEYLMDSAHV